MGGGAYRDVEKLGRQKMGECNLPTELDGALLLLIDRAKIRAMWGSYPKVR